MEPVRPDVRRRDQKAAHSSSILFVLAVASGRGFRADKRRDAQPLARAGDHEGEVLEVFATKRRDRHLNRRDIFKQNRAAALAEWRPLAA